MNLTHLAAVAAVLAAAPATAATVDFDALPGTGSLPTTSETLVGQQYASLGVTFQGIYGDGSSGLPVATTYAAGPAGANYSGNYLGNAQTGSPYVLTPAFAFTPRFQTLRINFANGASGISLSHNDFSLVTTTTFNAYDAAGGLLQSFTVNDGNGWAVRSLAVGDVYRLDLVASTGALGFNYFGIDRLNFTANAAAPVPEPATWGLMILGLAAVGISARRRRVTVRYAA